VDESGPVISAIQAIVRVCSGAALDALPADELGEPLDELLELDPQAAINSAESRTAPTLTMARGPLILRDIPVPSVK
jgi:hypothetical protein